MFEMTPLCKRVNLKKSLLFIYVQPVTKKGQLEKQLSSSLHRNVWKQYTFILNKHTLRYINEVTHEVSTIMVLISCAIIH